MKFIVVMFDGLRPDHVTAARMPNLAAFAETGVTFQSSHTIFPSETRVAVSSLVTGSWPQSHGIIANEFFDPSPGAARRIDTGSRDDLQTLAAAHDGVLLQRPSLSQRLSEAGLRHAVVSTASPGASFLLDHQAERLGQFAWSVHGKGNTPDALAQRIEDRFGPVPRAAVPNAPRIAHAARILTEFVLPELTPDVAVFWSSEPDTSYHARGVGSAEALAAQRAADRAFGEIVAYWHGSPDRAETQIIVASDHGQLTGAEKIDVVTVLKGAGFTAGTDFAAPADAVVVPGPMTSIYAQAPQVADRLQTWLQGQPWCGFVLRRHDAAGPGALSMREIGIEHARAPDLAFTFAGTDGDDASGAAGTYAFDGDLPAGAGMHGGLHRRELSNVLIAGGTAFATRLRSDVPAGLIDVAPTIAALLGLAPHGFDGRVLTESLAEGRGAKNIATQTLSVATPRGTRHLLLRRVGDYRYLAGDCANFE